tara:strand:+ start:2206 stop:2721 length:516 start_codon:yes stop_codon:yes gene_type:complete
MDQIESTGLILAERLQAGGKILACGNGGSASDSMHLCEELTGRYRETRRALPAISLNADGTALTCIANDFGFEEIFSRQVEALGVAGDVLIVFSTSGSSANILRALEAARERGMYSIALLGKSGGSALNQADSSIVVPSQESARIQEVHTFVLHRWLDVIEEILFGTERSQ